MFLLRLILCVSFLLVVLSSEFGNSQLRGKARLWYDMSFVKWDVKLYSCKTTNFEA